MTDERPQFEVEQFDPPAKPGHNVVVMVYAYGEDEAAALESLGLAGAMWDEMVMRAGEGDADAMDLMAQDDATLDVPIHHLLAAQIRRVCQDVPTAGEGAKAAHVAAGGSLGNRAQRRQKARRDKQQADMRDRLRNAKNN